MAVVGLMGDTDANSILFQVSDQTIETLSEWEWSGSANYATHQLHGHQALTEFTSLNPDQMSFEIILSWELGTDPLKTWWELCKLMRTGHAVPLTIGVHPYGYYRWSIVDMKNKIEYTDGEGNLYLIRVTLTLQEYLDQITL